MSAKHYRVRLFEHVIYEVDVEAETDADLVYAIEAIDQEAEFDPIKNFVSVEEREILEVFDAAGNPVDFEELLETAREESA